jgi:hypothetical protein
MSMCMSAGAALVLGAALLVPAPAQALAVAQASVLDVEDGVRTDEQLSGLATAEHVAVDGFRTGSAAASADHGTGRLAAFAEESFVQDGASNGVQGLALIDEILTFFGPEPGIVELSMGVVGFFRNVGGPSALGVGALLDFGSEHSAILATWSDAPGNDVGVVTRGEVTGLTAVPALIVGTLRTRLLLNPLDTVSVHARLGVSANAASNSLATAGFDHTAQLAITLPEGWSFTSSSGSFLTVPPPSPVPLPGGLGFGGAALLWLARFRRPRDAT